ncbi:hypothetical protein B5F13_11380 [Drancourtella sp. An177]|nr:hypothetical protein B5F13_11380 [Drancourtella sp. An177]
MAGMTFVYLYFIFTIPFVFSHIFVTNAVYYRIRQGKQLVEIKIFFFIIFSTAGAPPPATFFMPKPSQQKTRKQCFYPACGPYLYPADLSNKIL